MACAKTLAGLTGVCSGCTVPYSRAWCVSIRDGTLQKVVDQFKFNNAKAASGELAALLNDRLPELPESAVIVPIPTVAGHVRQRGYDHMLLVARDFARHRSLPVSRVLQRRTATTQRGSNRSTRQKQAKQAFACTTTLDENKVYLLIDDVVTTGSTLKHAAQTLRSSGAKTVWVATISYQALD